MMVSSTRVTLLLARFIFSLTATLGFVPGAALAQVGIGTTTPDPSAQLELQTTTRGFLPPRLSAVEMAAIASPAPGLVVYNTTAHQLYYRDGGLGVWLPVGSGLAAGTTWDRGGNTIANASLEWLGTANAQPLVFRTNSLEQMRIADNGNVGIGTPAPATPLHLQRAFSTTNTVEATLTLSRGTTGTAAAGIGQRVVFEAHNTAGSSVPATQLDAALTTATAGAETGLFVFRTRNAGIMEDRLRITGMGQVLIDATPSSNNPNLSMGSVTATPGIESASLAFRGNAIQHAGFSYIPHSTPGQGKLNLSFGLNANPGNNTALFTFQNNGNLGIGTTTPAVQLHTTGGVRLAGLPTDGTLDAGDEFVIRTSTGDLARYTGGLPGDNLGNHTATQNLDLATHLLVGEGGSAGLYINLDGNLGVGTTMPMGRLNVVGDWDQALVVSNPNDAEVGAGIYLQGANRSWAITATNAGAPDGGEHLGFYDALASAHRMLIDQSGNVGIGNTAPQHVLHLEGGISDFVAHFENNAEGAGLRVRRNQSAVDGNPALRVENNTGDNNDLISGDATNSGNLLNLSLNSTEVFQVSNDGNLALLRGVGYTWPNANSSGVLSNDGSGNLSWATVPGDNWGTQAAVATGFVTGDGTPGDPLRLVNGAGLGHVPTWNGTAWVSSTVPGDNLGNHTATTNIILGNHWLTGTNNTGGIGLDADGNVGINTAPSSTYTLHAVQSVTPAAGVAALRGNQTGGGAVATYGVHGSTASTSILGAGVYGNTANAGSGVYGVNSSALTSSAGVRGAHTTNTANVTYGVHGSTASTAGLGAGVFGTTSSAGFGIIGENLGSMSNSAAIYGNHASPTSNVTYGVIGRTFSTASTSAGVYGFTSSAGYGVHGYNDGSLSNSVGVFGYSNPISTPTNQTFGVVGITNSSHNFAAGVYGETSNGNFGVYGRSTVNTAGATGVRGIAGAVGANTTYGVYGSTLSSSSAAAGVYGNGSAFGAAGVRAESGGTGAGLHALNTGTGLAALIDGRANFTNEVQMSGNAGTAGQVLTSAGAGAPPTWSTLTGDDWGTQLATTAGVITGDGSGNPIRVVDGGAPGQTLIWSGASWAPGTLPGDNLGDHTATTQIQALAGTAAAPGYSFAGDLNTGVFSPSADALAISTAGAQRLVVDANGNVGIGAVATPDVRVTAAGNGSINTIYRANINGAVSAGSATYGYRANGTNTAAGVNITGYEAIITQNVANQTAFGINLSSSVTGGGTGFAYGGSFYATANSSSGPVGVYGSVGGNAANTSVRASRFLTIGGTAINAAGSSYAVEAQNQTTGGANAYGIHASATGSATNNYAIFATVSGGTNNYAGIFQGGNVGIGTAIPSAPLQVESTTSATSGTYNGTVNLLSFNNGAASSAQVRASISELNLLGPNNQSGMAYGAYNSTQKFGTGTTGEAGGAYNSMTSGVGSGTLSAGYGSFNVVENLHATAGMSIGIAVQGRGINSGNASMNALMGGQMGIRNTAAGSISNAYALNLEAPVNSGTITNYTSLLIGNITAGGIGTSRAIYYNHATAPFTLLGNGNVGVGTAAPVAQLHTTGTVRHAGLGTTATLTGYQLAAVNTSTGQLERYTGSMPGDNLGDHTATQNLDMKNYDIIAVSNIEMVRDANTNSLVNTVYSNSSGHQPRIFFQKAQGSSGVPAALADGDVLGNITFAGHTGGGFAMSTFIDAVAVGAFSAGSAGSSLAISTTPQGSTTPAERLRIAHDGNIGIGTAAPTAQLHSTGSVRFSGVATIGTFSDPTDDWLIVDAGGNLRRYTGALPGDNLGSHVATNLIQGLAGSAATPGYTFTTSLTTGMFLPAANALGFSTAGVERMRIDNGGNVGIGTAPVAGTILRIQPGGGVNYGIRADASANVAFPATAGVVGNYTGTNSGTGVLGDNTSTVGRGVSGRSTAATGLNYGVWGQSASTTGVGTYGENTSATGVVYGVQGSIVSTTANAAAVYGNASGGGVNGVFGVLGQSNANSGSAAGVKGIATGATADVSGVWGEVSSTGNFAAGVYGRNTSASGQNYGVYGRVTANTTDFSAGVRGMHDGLTGITYGVQGVANSSSAFSAGVSGIQTANGRVYGTYGEISASTTDSASGVRGDARAGVGLRFGVIGKSSATGALAAGVFGESIQTSAINTMGVWGHTNSAGVGSAGVYGTTTTGGYGVWGFHNGTTNNSAAVRGNHNAATANVTYGVSGVSASTNVNSAGVHGANSGSGWAGRFDGSLAAGTSQQFRVSTAGDLTMIRNVAYSWPATAGAANTFLRNDGAGNLTWTAAPGDNLGNHIMTTNLITDLKWISGDGDNEGLMVNYSGNVGVGIATPQTQLHINDLSNSAGNMLITAGTSTGTLLTDGLLLKVTSSGASMINNENRPLHLGTNATTHLTIDPTGLVGIGTDPGLYGGGLSIEMEESAGSIVLNQTGNSYAPQFQMIRNRGTEASPLPVLTGNSLGTFSFLGRSTTGNFLPGAVIEAVAAQNFTSTTQSGTNLMFSTTPIGSSTPAERVRITAAGNVGIGTTGPGSLLSVAGGLAVGATYAGFIAPANGAIFQGNVGIGVTGPSAQLHVETAATTEIRNVSTAANNVARYVARANTVELQMLADASSSLAMLGTLSNNALTFRTNNVERMQISTSGNIGIGTGAPSSLLHMVYEDALTSTQYSARFERLTTGTPTAGIGVGILLRAESLSGIAQNAAGITGALSNVTAGGEQGYLSFITNNAGAFTEKVRILHNGNVGVGTATPLERLEVAGNIRTQGEFVYDAPRTRYEAVGINGFAMVNADSTAFPRPAGSNSYMHISGNSNTSVSATCVRDVELPDGAVIQSIDAYLFDQDGFPTNAQVILRRNNLSTGGFGTMATATVTAESGTVQVINATVPPVLATVDNSVYRYSIEFRGNRGLTSGINCRFYGVRINYTVNRAD